MQEKAYLVAWDPDFIMTGKASGETSVSRTQV